jgi:hypothetical protein
MNLSINHSQPRISSSSNLQLYHAYNPTPDIENEKCIVQFTDNGNKWKMKAPKKGKETYRKVNPPFLPTFTNATVHAGR